MARSELVVDLGAIRRNVRTLRRVLGRTELWAVVKADGYGHGAAEVGAAALAEGARTRLGADVAVSVTGVAGPDGGSASKPVGTVFLHASGPAGERSLEFSYPGDRNGIRSRSTVAALHLVRRLLTQS